MNKKIYERNLLALSVNNPEVSSKLKELEEEKTNVHFILSKTNLLIPTLKTSTGNIPLHSTFDPIKEAGRYYATTKKSEFMIFIGFGAGYHILPFLQEKEISQIVVIEKDLTLFKSVLENIDVSNILTDPRLTLLVDISPEQIKQFFLSNYFPAISGDLQTIILQPILRAQKDFLNSVIIAIKEAISKIADDYTVQAHFGKKWFTNTLLNLGVAEKSYLTLKPIREVIITGAGPSLEVQLNEIKQIKKRAVLLATDTSLPFLLDNDIIPDLVISIDCQQVSYHHFLKGLPPDVPLIIDLASPPILTRLTEKIIFFSSNHPFSIFVNRKWRSFPIIDTSGGNVSHAAVSLAHKLGAEKIYLFGIDYSYPEGKAYARGTYIYPYFRSLENRVHPIETMLFDFIMHNKTISKTYRNSTIIYTTKPMSSYKTRLEEYINSIDCEIIQSPGKGMKLNIPSCISHTTQPTLKKIFAAGPYTVSWRQFLQNYLSLVEKLPEPYLPLGKYLKNLSMEERDIWFTQFPAAAAIRELDKLSDIPPSELLKRVREWTLSKITHILEN